MHEIPGQLYTVNPVAVNSPMCNVFTENKRVRMTIETKHFGEVQFVAIGATAVGSIVFTVKPGTKVKKGEELGYFAFGGSTCILVVPEGLLQVDPDIGLLSRKCVSLGLALLGVAAVPAT
jgi:phosphatidylserine decarboxylase